MKTIKLGVTGGIGSGKSYVCEALQRMGIAVYDCDSQAKQLMITHPIIKEQLIDLLGKEVYAPDGSLNKPLVASFLFKNKSAAKQIEAIVHPVVKAHFIRWTHQNEAPFIAMESAILFQSGFHHLVDHVIYVSAPLDVRIERVLQRDHCTQAQVEARIKAQMSEEEMQKRSDYVIVNDGHEDVVEQLKRVLGIG